MNDIWRMNTNFQSDVFLYESFIFLLPCEKEYKTGTQKQIFLLIHNVFFLSFVTFDRMFLLLFTTPVFFYHQLNVFTKCISTISQRSKEKINEKKNILSTYSNKWFIVISNYYSIMTILENNWNIFMYVIKKKGRYQG